MGRSRQWTHAKSRGVEAVAFPAAPAERDPAAPRFDRSPMGFARRDADGTAAIMRGTIAEMQSLAARIDPDAAPQHLAHALQQVVTAAVSAITLAGRLRGIRETTANFEETP